MEDKEKQNASRFRVYYSTVGNDGYGEAGDKLCQAELPAVGEPNPSACVQVHHDAVLSGFSEETASTQIIRGDQYMTANERI